MTLLNVSGSMMQLFVRWYQKVSKLTRTLMAAISMANQRPLCQSTDTYFGFKMHLLTSDLWEAITGERLSPALLCQLFDGSSQPVCETGHVNRILFMAKDRQKSRELQEELATCSDSERNTIFTVLFQNISDLVADPVANFVLQKLCDVADEQQQKQLLSYFITRCQSIVNHPTSCRVLQKFIETTNEANILEIYTVMKPDLVKYCLSPNGNHIVQRFVASLPRKVNEIVDIIKDHVITLAVDNCGCRVVQKLFDQYDVSALKPLVDRVMTRAVDLATNQYGNYVVQYILADKSNVSVSQLVDVFAGHFYDFSVHKFASNVIEKCIRGATDAQREKIFHEILGGEGSYDDRRIRNMIVDQFGNYVIQRIVEFGTEQQQIAVYDVVYDHYDELVQQPYARHVIAKLEYLDFEF